MKRNIFAGLLLIGFAILLLINHLGFDFHISIWVIVKIILGLYIVFKGIRKRTFTLLLPGAGLLLCQANNIKHWMNIDHWVIMLVAFLIGIGLDMIFKGFKVEFSVDLDDTENLLTDSTEVRKFGEEISVDSGTIELDNNFASASKYITAQDITRVILGNNFGSMNVYMENATIAESGATIQCESNFGELRLYLPRESRVQVSEDNFCGSVEYIGRPSSDENAPLIHIETSSNFGHIKVFFDNH